MSEERTYPISEIYGPVFQGEGRLIGTPMNVLRFAGCDSDCSWCDTKYAVSPKYPKWEKTDMTAYEIIAAIPNNKVKWLMVTGGNPVLFLDRNLCCAFTNLGKNIAIETQGTRLDDFLQYNDLVEELTISPKSPSSGMAGKTPWGKILDICRERNEIDLSTTLKFVVMDANDILWLKETIVGLDLHRVPCHLYVSIGTMSIDGASEILNRLRFVFNTMQHEPILRNIPVLPQLHVLVYGQKRGV